MGMVAICLPTLRPLFAGWSIEKIVQSVRSAISLRSLSSHHSLRDPERHSQGLNANKNVEPKTSEQELVGIYAPSFSPENNVHESQAHAESSIERSDSADEYARGVIRVERDFHVDSGRTV